jgi:hypothetical protein
MFKRIQELVANRRITQSHKAAQKNFDGYRRSLRHEHLEGRCMLATLTVSVTSDGGIVVNDGNLTLREAISYANLTAAPGTADRAWIDESVQPLGQNDVITFATNLFTNNLATIALTQPISITKPLTIQCPTNDNVILTPSATFSGDEGFYIHPNITSSGSGLTFTIKDLVFSNFKYGIHITDTGGGGSTPTANAEKVVIDSDGFANNQRGVFIQGYFGSFQVLGKQKGANKRGQN